MTKEDIICLIFGLISLIGTFIGYYFSIRSKLVGKTASAINDAESTGLEGEEKLRMATDDLYACVPAFLRPFFSKEQIKLMIQLAFDKINEFAKKQ